MAREFFKNLPDTSTPLRAERINGLLDGEEAMGSIVVDDVECKNLFSGFRAGTYNSTTGNYDPSGAGISTNKIPVKSGETYILKGISSGNSIRILYWNDNSASTSYVTSETKTSSSSGNIITPQGNYLAIQTGANVTYSNVQLEIGSTATNYVPYRKVIKEQNGCIKEDTTFYANDFKSKNMFVPTKTNNGTNIALYQATLNMEDDEFVFTATGTAIYFGNVKAEGADYTNDRGVLIDVEGISSICYTLTNPSFNQTYITAYDSTKKSLGYVHRALSSGSYDIPAGAKYITLRFGVNNTTSGTVYRTKVQLEVGSQSTPYTPYKRTIKEENGNVKEDTTFYANDFKCKNLFNINSTPTWISGNDMTWSVSNNELTVSGKYYIGFLVDVKANTNYYMSSIRTITTSTTNTGSIRIFKSDQTSITSHNTGNFTFNTGDNTQIYIVFYSGSGSTGVVKFSNTQLEVGSEPTPYTEYKNFENEEIYSTNEMVIGRWIDGKPLYRKVVTGAVGTVSSDGTIINTSINVGISNVDTIFIKNAYVNNGNNRLFPIPYSNDNGYWIKVYPLSGANYPNLRIGCNASTFSTNPVTVIVEYTKTTDV